MKELTVKENRQISPELENWLNPEVFDQIWRVGVALAKSSIVPPHLSGKTEDCFLIAQQAFKWGLEPLSVCQATSVVRGKLCYEGKLVAAVIDRLSGIKLNYKYEGDGVNRSVVVSGKRKGDQEPVELKIIAKDVATENAQWKVNRDQMLAYRGARDWARRYEPGAFMGVYTADEIEESMPKDVTPLKKSKIEALEDSFKDIEIDIDNDIAEDKEEPKNELVLQDNSFVLPDGEVKAYPDEITNSQIIDIVNGFSGDKSKFLTDGNISVLQDVRDWFAENGRGLDAKKIQKFIAE